MTVDRAADFVTRARERVEEINGGDLDGRLAFLAILYDSTPEALAESVADVTFEVVPEGDWFSLRADVRLRRSVEQVLIEGSISP